jgi:sugar lactone lactonase YvrE
VDTSTTTLARELGFTEAPRWHDGKLWFSDFHHGRVATVDADGAVETVLTVEGTPSGLGWDPSGRLLVVSMTERALLRQGPGGLERFADLSAHTVSRANDMVVDALGGAYVSSFGFDLMTGAEPAAADLVRVSPSGEVSVAAQDVWFPNGMVLTDDGRTLVLAETYASRLTAFDVAADGTLSGRRVFAELPGIAPDGIGLDAEGQVWVATARQPEVVRVREGGEITARVTVSSGSNAYACMLGGQDGRTLFVCTAPTFHLDGPPRP